MTKKSIYQLPEDQIEALLRANAKSESIERPYGITWKHATATLNSNNPIEDANAQLILRQNPKGKAKVSPGDLLFFAVMDGHAGPHTSRLLSKALIPAVALELSTLDQPSTERRSLEPSNYSALTYLKSTLHYLGSLLPASISPFAHIPSEDPKYVQLAIQTAFANLDSEIVNAPIRVLEMLQANAGSLKPWEHPMAEASMLPALSGSCALLAVLDTARRDLHVAVTGDSRAVAGYWEEDVNGEGKWRVEVLTEDQTGRNVNEYQRMVAEHPPEEASFVIQRGRVLGGLEPTRAFGDSNYKWPREADILAPASWICVPQVSYQPQDTPLRDQSTCHYSTRAPFPDTPNQKQRSGSKSNLRFLVLATDGLWDELSSSEVVSLVGAYFNGRRGNVSKSDLAKSVFTPAETAGIEGKSTESKAKQGSTEGEWAFVDENVGTHLIRNAFGGADREKLHQLLSIPAPYSRRYRDDITVTVVWWEPNEQNREAKVKAKL
ncbi:protein phosphatase 2C [Ceratobasidium sp. AG-Ba]|nr:protein phosphatase 2C [Ceratobasidium sp. AG-Ba]